MNRDYANDDSDTDDDRGHGTHVAGIASGAKDNLGMHGVAFNAKIIPYKALDSNGSGFDPSIGLAINQSTYDDAKIINLSLGFPADPYWVGIFIRYARDYDILTIAATGNDGENQPLYPAANAADSDLENYLIAVGSVNSNNQRSYFSNACGNARDFCLFAPGERINSAYYTGQSDYVKLSGTSMATPIVSGAAAIIRSAWPHLTASQTAQILLLTATDLGDPGTDSIFGRGLLNIEAAVNSYGQNNIVSSSSVSSAGYDLSNSQIVTSTIFGDAFSKNIAPIIRDTIILDDFGRDFKSNLDQKIFQEGRVSLLPNLIFNQYKSASFPLSHHNELNFNFKFLTKKRLHNQIDNKIVQNDLNSKYLIEDNSKNDNSKIPSGNISFSFQKNIGENFTMVFAGNDYVANRKNKFTSQYSLINNNFSPFSQIAKNNLISSQSGQDLNQKEFFLEQKITNNFSTNFSFATTSNNQKLSNNNISSKIFQSGFNYQFDSFDFNLDYGKLSEYQNRFLGSISEGAFSNDKNSNTNFITLVGQKRVYKNLYFVSSYSEGSTNLSGNDYGIFRNYSKIKSRGYSFGVFNDGFFGGKLAVNYSWPLKVYKGSVDIDIPIARDIDGNVTRLQVNGVSLKPSGKQRDLEISYNFYRESSNLQFNFLAIEEPMNIQDAGNEYLYFIQYSTKF